MISLIWTAVIGLVAGLIARAVHPGDDKMSWFYTMLLGVGGSFFATFLGRILGLYKSGSSAGFIMSIVGAVALLAIYNYIERKRLTKG